MRPPLTPSEYDLPKEISVSFTGHRPEKLPWGADERDPRCVRLKERLDAEILKAYGLGARYFLSGMADGFDLYAAEAVLRLSAACPGMELVAVFPYGTGGSKRKKAAAARAFRVVSAAESFVAGCFAVRNRFLVEHSSRLICGFGGDMASGTGLTVRMAAESGIGITVINID